MTRILTGITTTGTPHLGNYAGAIRPAIQASYDKSTQPFYFLADYHALIKCDDSARIHLSRLEIAATWIACGLDTEHAIFYRQSDVPETLELSWMLSCITNKGLLNRAHAYKSAIAKNIEQKEDPDASITMGLFSYPVLMAADILLFNAHKVPVGRDQIQHVEMARDIAQRFNFLFASHEPFFTLPEAIIDENVATLPGLDGRKMSKSYDNTIALFGSGKQLKDSVARIITDSKSPGEAKNPDASALVTIYNAFSSKEQSIELREDLIKGLAWGEAKKRLCVLLENQLGEARDNYNELMKQPDTLEDILLQGAVKARNIAQPFVEKLRNAVGLRSFVQENKSTTKEKQKNKKTARFITFRDDQGFRFRFISSTGQELFLSKPFISGQIAGQFIKMLHQPDDFDISEQGNHFIVNVCGELIAQSGFFDSTKSSITAIEHCKEELLSLQ
ncbi:UNVERIFIED_CONTAM: hypothetical protein GTU68_056358 [Idotea baltica]|nr:hypothetical protein [Idotea baltica]